MHVYLLFCFVIAPFLPQEGDGIPHEMLHLLESLPVAIYPPVEFKSRRSTVRKTKRVLHDGNGFPKLHEYYDLPFVDSKDIAEALSSCSYDPSYTKKRDWPRYHGAVYGTFYTDVWPSDGTSGFNCQPNIVYRGCEGNRLIPHKEAKNVVNMFMEAINKNGP